MRCCEHGDERSGLIRPQAFLAQLKNRKRFTSLAPVLCCNTICYSSLGARDVRHSSQVCREMAAQPGALPTAAESRWKGAEQGRSVAFHNKRNGFQTYSSRETVSASAVAKCPSQQTETSMRWDHRGAVSERCLSAPDTTMTAFRMAGGGGRIVRWMSVVSFRPEKGNTIRTHCTASWVGPTADMNGFEKTLSCSYPNSNPGSGSV